MLTVPFLGSPKELSRFTQKAGTSVVLASGAGGGTGLFPSELAEQISAWSAHVKLAAASPQALQRVAVDPIHPNDIFIFADGKLSWRSEPALSLDTQGVASHAVSVFISALFQQSYQQLKHRERNEAILTRVKLVAMERLLKQRARRAKAPAPMPEPVEDPYAVLGLPLEATFEQARAARNTLLLQYHPDKVAGLGPKLREVAEAETKRINAAFAHLQSRLGPASREPR